MDAVHQQSISSRDVWFCLKERMIFSIHGTITRFPSNVTSIDFSLIWKSPIGESIDYLNITLEQTLKNSERCLLPSQIRSVTTGSRISMNRSVGLFCNDDDQTREWLDHGLSHAPHFWESFFSIARLDQHRTAVHQPWSRSNIESLYRWDDHFWFSPMVRLGWMSSIRTSFVFVRLFQPVALHQRECQSVGDEINRPSPLLR